MNRPGAMSMLGRALILSCPRCGSRGLFRSWFHVRERCPRCGLELERGEQHDYWIGGMMFNIVLSEMLAVLVVTTIVLSRWPDVPWNVVWIGTVVLMLATPFLLYPMSRLVWLAFDLVFRPAD